ncbi:MAG TPA: fused MFS/spermidine synthase, partial [Vicinamibacterales bacterium]|nr:fused MFS/spermidine synthase [Vicinamibacterales bacterium]
LPMIVHPDAKDALVIGLGGGATAGAVSQHPGVNVDVVELSREVTRAANRFFRPINDNVLQKPNVTLHVDDGRNFLLFSQKKYDVVTADVILPIHAGSGNLYSTTYFELVRKSLKPGGMALQWVAGTEAEYKMIMRTFVRVFPETTLWADGGLMLGSVTPITLRQTDHDRKMQDPASRALLTSLQLDTFDKLLGEFVAGPDELRAFVGNGPVLTDDRPLVEYFLSLPRDTQPDLSGLRNGGQKFLERSVIR